jgi:hypothetical protein
MAVSIADMEQFAIGGDNLRFDSDLGNTIELGDMGDDFGMGLLANGNFNIKKSSDTGRTVNIDTMSNGRNNVNFDLEPIEPISLGGIESMPIDLNDFGSSAPTINVVREQSNPFTPSTNSFSAPPIQLSQRDPEGERKEKTELINKLQRLEQRGFPVSRKFTLDNSLAEIKDEYNRLLDARNLEASLKFQRQMLMGAITGMEWLNGRFDPFDLKLEGWSESVHENVEDFDEIFEELYDKYKDKGKMSPEMRLVMAIGGSGFMCHVSNSFFRSKMPSMDDVLRRNPELAKQMAAAAAQQAGQGFGNFMGMAMGVQQPVNGAPTSGFPGNGGPPPIGPNSMNQPPMSWSAGNLQQPSVTQNGAFYSASGSPPAMTPQSVMNQPKPTTVRREMSGPSGVDDILKTFEEVRRAEMTMNNSMEPMTGMQMGPAVAATMSGTVSVISAEDMMSQAESQRTGVTAPGRRRRKVQAPVGNTISLNV